MRSVPLLDRQPVDVLRRIGATAQKAAMEQWQRGEVVTSTNGITSHGGDKPVAVRVLSSGDAVLGVSYGVKHDTLNLPPSTPIEDTPRSGISNTDTPTKNASFLPPGESSSSLVLADPSHLSPSGLFGKWVPTAADVTPISSSSATILPNLRDLPLRGKTCFKDQADVTARFLYTGEGRRALGDFDLVDICLPANKVIFNNQQQTSIREEEDREEEEEEIGKLRTIWKSPLEEALELVHGPSLGHYGQKMHPVLLTGETLSATGEAIAAISSSTSTLSASSNTTKTTAFSGPRRRPLLAASLWRLARVRLLEGGLEAAKELAGHYNSTLKRNILDISSVDKTTSSLGEASLKSSTSTESLVSTPLQAFVFWFEATFQAVAEESALVDEQVEVPRHLKIRPILRFAPLRKIHSVAPAGTYTISFVPGQKIESRRAGGLWAPCDVVAADRFALCVRVRRPPKGGDSSALVPNAFAQFEKNAKPMKATTVGSNGASDAQKKLTNVYAKRYGGNQGMKSIGGSTISNTVTLHDDSEMSLSSPASAHLQKAEMKKRSSSAKPRRSSEDSKVVEVLVQPNSLIETLPLNLNTTTPMSRRDRVAAAARGGTSTQSTATTSTTATAVVVSSTIPVFVEPLISSPQLQVPNTEESAWIATTVSPEAHLETIPRHFWHLFVARAGHFCSESLMVQDASSFVQDAFPSSKERGRAKVANRFGEQSEKAISSKPGGGQGNGFKNGKSGGLVLAISSLDLDLAKKRAKRVV